MTPYELYQWALERGLENEQLYLEDKYGERTVDEADLQVEEYSFKGAWKIIL
jgi:hypothetical protein